MAVFECTPLDNSRDIRYPGMPVEHNNTGLRHQAHRPSPGKKNIKIEKRRRSENHVP